MNGGVQLLPPISCSIDWSARNHVRAGSRFVLKVESIDNELLH